ncbi:MAG TPA: ABC transporter substrate-binding protein [Candidatus Limnocylindria bacterium]|nr:ABC transporter substrate-binding protein [Candidatus Limnocylindria bacterium]
MRKFKWMAPAMVAALVLAACSGNSEESGGGGGGGGDLAEGDGEISVTSLWGGAEGEAFQAVLDAFEEKTGIHAEYETVRDDYATVLSTRVTGGDPPDIAIMPGIGFMRSFARDDLLIPLEDLGIARADIEDRFAPGILDIGTVDDVLYAPMVKFNSKSTVWYHPNDFADRGIEVPETWDDMVALQDNYDEPAWACGCADTWNLTDWFESIYIRQHGVEMYDQLFGGELPFTDQSVKDSIAEMAKILNDESLVGGITGAFGTTFTDAIGQTFAADNQAWLFYEGGFVGGIALGQVNEDLVIGEDIGWFDFPPINDNGSPVTIGGDVIAAFVADSDVAEFMEYLISVEGGTVWAEQGTIISPIIGVDSSVYPNELISQEAEQVANAEAVRFDGSDLLPAGSPDLGATLQTAISNPDGIDQALEEFQTGVENAFADAEG